MTYVTRYYSKTVVVTQPCQMLLLQIVQMCISLYALTVNVRALLSSLCIINQLLTRKLKGICSRSVIREFVEFLDSVLAKEFYRYSCSGQR